MKPANGKHGSAMATNTAKKIQRQNARRASNKVLQEEVAASGLGIHQVEHFLKMSQVELELARMESKMELSRLWIMPESPAKQDKTDRHERVVAYINSIEQRMKDGQWTKI